MVRRYILLKLPTTQVGAWPRSRQERGNLTTNGWWRKNKPTDKEDSVLGYLLLASQGKSARLETVVSPVTGALSLPAVLALGQPNKENMDKILTQLQITIYRERQYHTDDVPTLDDILESHEALREQLAQMKAGYEDALTEQQMGEGYIADLKAQLAEAQADVRALVKASRNAHVNELGRVTMRRALSRPGVKRVMEKQDAENAPTDSLGPGCGHRDTYG